MRDMALASQTIRNADRNRYMTNSRRRRGRGPLLVGVVLSALAIGGVWWLVSTYGATDDTPTSPTLAAKPISEGSGAKPGGSTPSDRTPKAAPAKSGLLTPEPPSERTTAPPLDDGNRGGSGTTPAKAGGAPGDAGSAPIAATPSGAKSESSAEASRSVPNESAGGANGADGTGASTLAGNDTAPGARDELTRLMALASTAPVESRRELTRLLDGSTLSSADRLRAYDAINQVNQPLFFQSGVIQGDPVFVLHQVEQGDTPQSIVRALNAACDGDLLVRVNGVADARKIRIGQVLKVPKGPFHVEVRKAEYRLNILHGEGAQRVMIASYPVGLGEFNMTPTGIFKVRPKSKLKDPQWRNPRTGEFFEAKDPKNPIGERWIGLEGIEPHNKDFAGYGIHGTIEPESIGQMRSMGCIRMRAPDVEVVYELLTVPDSTIVIAP